MDCTAVSNALGCLAVSKIPDVANCILLEAENPADLTPHMFAFTYRSLARSQPLILLDAKPSCPRFLHSAEVDAQAQPQLQAAPQLPIPSQVQDAPMQQPADASAELQAAAAEAGETAQPAVHEAAPEAAPHSSLVAQPAAGTAQQGGGDGANVVQQAVGLQHATGPQNEPERCMSPGNHHPAAGNSDRDLLGHTLPQCSSNAMQPQSHAVSPPSSRAEQMHRKMMLLGQREQTCTEQCKLHLQLLLSAQGALEEGSSRAAERCARVLRAGPTEAQQMVDEQLDQVASRNKLLSHLREAYNLLLGLGAT